MTAYLETARIAHVMEWHGDAGYDALCNKYSTCIRGRDLVASEWPIRYASADKQPGKPWCRLCVARLRSRIDYWMETVIAPPHLPKGLS